MADQQFWEDFLARGTLESEEASQANRKFGRLNASLPPGLVKDIYRFFLEEASWRFFSATKSTIDEHVPVLLDVIEKSSDVRANFLRAAHDKGGPDGLRAAGAFLALLSRSTNAPGAVKNVKNNWEKWGAERFVDHAIEVLTPERSSARVPKGQEAIFFYVLVFLVARGAGSHPLLTELQKHEDLNAYKVLDRTLAAAARRD